MPWRAVYENSVQMLKNKFSSKIKNGRLLCRLTGSSPHHGKAQCLKPFDSWVRRDSGSMTFTWKHYIFLGSQGDYQQQTSFEDVLLKSHTTSLWQRPGGINVLLLRPRGSAGGQEDHTEQSGKLRRRWRERWIGGREGQWSNQGIRVHF